jgi:hypothetical protein
LTRRPENVEIPQIPLVWVYEKGVGRDRQKRKKGVSSCVRLGRDLAFETI